MLFLQVLLHVFLFAVKLAYSKYVWISYLIGGHFLVYLYG